MLRGLISADVPSACRVVRLGDGPNEVACEENEISRYLMSVDQTEM